MKIGFGYDIHRLEKGRKLVLAGVYIPNPKGLLGHSDGDVVLHAVCDAILGALGYSDIGEHFPDTDPAYKNIASTKLLERVYQLMKQKRRIIGNVDVTVIAEKPKISELKEKMRENISTVLHTKKENINIKATTNEGLGPVGSQDAIACYVAVLITEEV